MDEAAKHLGNECGEDIPRREMAGIDRLQLAAIRLSRGSLEGLSKATSLAQQDFRDLLMAAGFGEDVEAHKSWWPWFAFLSATIHITPNLRSNLALEGRTLTAALPRPIALDSGIGVTISL